LHPMKYDRLSTKLGIKHKASTRKANKANKATLTPDDTPTPKEYKRKQPEASNDYTTAYNIAKTLGNGAKIKATIDNKVRFRKYLYDLGKINNKRFSTRLINEHRIEVFLLP
jgi:hypothetical protein